MFVFSSGLNFEGPIVSSIVFITAISHTPLGPSWSDTNLNGSCEVPNKTSEDEKSKSVLS